MAVFSHIRTLYTPVQPFVKQGEGEVVYRELLPDPRLQEYVFCYWQLKMDRPMPHAFDYRVVADGCMDIFFEWQRPQESFVMGFSDACTSFPLEGPFDYVGIRFLPGMFPRLFHSDAGELSDQVTALADVAPVAARLLSDHFREGMGLHRLQTLLDGFLMQVVSKAKEADHRVQEAVDLIVRTAGIITLKTELPPGISSRQLRRLFSFYIGDTPKVFSKVVRFQQVLQSTHAGEGIRKNRSYLDAGYYDQAHFIREFQRLYGLTPAKVFHK
ncbi:AraC family transcriptional regulator [Chitinophaga arvensicola]|uniref:Helix-turn-helix domain-containing protein n=1 Tax=Chitinophaga arvensicola TaxID=29529 RepID=A0A1I0SAC6_9BACT|nr:helix-turn-helix domain-containing protein [Chitinophaga arvensicola]SEW53409.1 Helix-turn-helix domain-containing protein [Chitinophaga arvensicola]